MEYFLQASFYDNGQGQTESSLIIREGKEKEEIYIHPLEKKITVEKSFDSLKELFEFLNSPLTDKDKKENRSLYEHLSTTLIYFRTDYNAPLPEELKEFNKTHGISINNVTNLHYMGPAGEFDYNPNEYEVKIISYNDPKIHKDIPLETLVYNLALNKIAPRIPEGVINLYNTFKYHKTIENVEIPSSAKIIRGMLSCCPNITRGVNIPEGVTDANSLYFNSTNIEIPSFFPESVEDSDFCYGYCTNLLFIPEKSPNDHSINTFYHVGKDKMVLSKDQYVEQEEEYEQR